MLGGEEALCYRLQVPAADLSKWASGTAPMPRAIFLKIVDVLIEETRPPG